MATVSVSGFWALAGAVPNRLQRTCAGNSFLMALTAWTGPKQELFVSVISSEILNLLKLSKLFNKRGSSKAALLCRILK